MKSDAFWRYFDQLRPLLAARAESFAKTFEYLDRFDRPVGIVETGCVRAAGNWGGDGGSTILFDKYAQFHEGTVFTVDIDAKATAVCRSNVSDRVNIHTGDSVPYLKSLAEAPPDTLRHLDLLYLDSFDLDYENVFPSAFHHFKELMAIGPLIRPDTLIVIDDSPVTFTGFLETTEKVQVATRPKIGGKGKLIAEYAQQIGAENLFSLYQCGWTKFRKAAPPPGA